MPIMKLRGALFGTAAAIGLLAGAADAQDRNHSYTLYGTPGLIEMPSALSAPDAEFAITQGLFDGTSRTNLTFQITPRFSGTFRYANVSDFGGPDSGQYFDRSFDLRFRLTDEGEWMPAIAIGLQDFMGTGLYSSEYVVATKTLSDTVRVTAGLGWGRLGTYNGFSNPLGLISDYFDDRPGGFNEGQTGGEPEIDRFFRGPVALFGGVEWAFSDTMTFKAEYSSDDAYTDRRGRPLIDRRSPFNFGLNWEPAPGYQVGLSYLYGSEFALTGTVMINPNERPFQAGLDSPPPPVRVRPADVSAALTWTQAQDARGPLDARLAQALDAEGLVLQGYSVAGTTATVRFANPEYRAEPQALGRVARILSAELPASVDTFVLEPQRNGMPISAISLPRAAVEQFENTADGSADILAAATIGEAALGADLTPVAPLQDRLTWGIAPYLSLYVFDGDNPVRVDTGLRFNASYELAPNLIASTRIRYSLLGPDDPGAISPSTLPPVRRNIGFYAIEGNPGIERAQLAWYSRPADQIYGRVTVGLLETMYAGVSAELLWKPVDSRFALGAEVNHVWQRDFDMLLSFQDYEVTTGHVSAYYDFRNGFHGQIDVGRYLAGDWGATFALDRQFENGWRVGAYFTLTDVPFEDFGEGSFDKGIRFSIPFDYLIGQPSRRELNNVLSSLTRDGGARVNVDGRLYDMVRDGHLADMEDTWGRFWR
jgi:hypothetical protein